MKTDTNDIWIAEYDFENKVGHVCSLADRLCEVKPAFIEGRVVWVDSVASRWVPVGEAYATEQEAHDALHQIEMNLHN